MTGTMVTDNWKVKAAKDLDSHVKEFRLCPDTN